MFTLDTRAALGNEWTRDWSVVLSNPIKGAHCLLRQTSSHSLCSTNGFKSVQCPLATLYSNI